MQDKLYTPIKMQVLPADPAAPPADYAYLYPKSNGLTIKLSDGTIMELAGQPTSLLDVDPNIFGQLTWSTTDIDWSDERVRVKTLAANETWTFSNLKAGKTLSLYVTGDFAITLPTSVTKLAGDSYVGTTNNLIIFHCINDVAGSEKVIGQIFNL